MQAEKILDNFRKHLPHNPYCSDDLDREGCYKRPLDIALTKIFIQLNPPQSKNFLSFDLDHEDGTSIWKDKGLPWPNFLVHSKTKGHTHVIYILDNPVWLSSNAKIKPIEYFHAIENAYRTELKGDENFPSFLVRNPNTNPAFCLHTKKYSLNTLEKELPKALNEYKKLPVEQEPGAGRNAHLFAMTRKWGYVAVRDFRDLSREEWIDAVFDYVEHQNKFFTHPLFRSEVRSIARSVSKWIWKEDQKHYEKFMNRQKAIGKLGGLASGQARLAKNQHLREQAKILTQQGLSTRKIAGLLDVSAMTISRWLKQEV